MRAEHTAGICRDHSHREYFLLEVIHSNESVSLLPRDHKEKVGFEKERRVSPEGRVAGAWDFY